MAVTREQLFEEVWAEPMTAVAARYGISGNFLARVCERLGVPRPPRGYWAKLKVGKQAERPTLPEAGPGDEQTWSQPGDLPPRPRMPRRPSPPRIVDPLEVQPRRSRRSGRHPLIVEATPHFEKVRMSYEGYLQPYKRRIVDVFATKEALPRALETASKVFQTLEEREFRVVLAPWDQHFSRPVINVREKSRPHGYCYGGWSPDRPTVVFVGDVAIGLAIYEYMVEVHGYSKGDTWVTLPKPTAASYDDTRYLRAYSKDMPTGRFCLRAWSPYPGTNWQREWRESKVGDLKRQADEIAAALEDQAPAIVRMVEEAQRQAEEARVRAEAEYRERMRREAERRYQQAIEEGRKELLTIVDGWALATRLEQFFAEVARGAVTLDQVERGALEARLDHARELFGGPDAIGHFRRWRTAEERLGSVGSQRVDDLHEQTDRGQSGAVPVQGAEWYKRPWYRRR